MPKKAPDIDVLFEDLAATHPGRGRYDKMDKYRDFRAVFLSGEQGKRVLYEILSWGHMFHSTPFLAQYDSHKTMYHEGERNLALRIFGTVHEEPPEQPTRQTTKE